jgi:hypothetical protein
MDIKALIEGPGHGGLPGINMCNIARDPGEKSVDRDPHSRTWSKVTWL